MGRIGSQALEAFIAFGTASVAVMEVAELGARVSPGRQALELFAEIEVSHTALRALFAEGHDGAVCALALSILVLAERTEDALVQDMDLPGT